MRPLTIISLLLVIQIGVFGQDKAIDYKELQKKLPDNINGYAVDGDPDGSSFEMNGMSYSTASKSYKKGDAELTIMIADYRGAASIYQASTIAWANGMSYEDDHQEAHGVSIEGSNGWFTLNKDENRAQLIVAYKNRYLVTIDASDTSDEGFVKAILQKLDLGSLP